MAIQPAMVPYLWRRHLGILRALLAVLCVLLYLLYPVPAGPAVALAIGIFAIYSVFILLRDNIENRVYQLPILALDVIFFFACALHPTQEGLWLSTVCYFYLLCIASLMYEWKAVAGVVLLSVFFFAVVRPVPG